MKVSVLLLTLNEARNLPACLDALNWCDDVVVVDSGSTDETIAIALARGARVISRTFDSFAGQRNHGLEAGGLRHPWVLHLDADEVVTEAFARRLAELQPPDRIDAYRVPFMTMFLGRRLRHAGMWPAYQVRLGRAKGLRFVQVGHGQREDLPPERVETFPEPLLHYSFSHGLRAWLEKHLRYARDEAAELAEERRKPGAWRAALAGADLTVRRRALKSLAARLPLFSRPFARFGYVYLWRGGFRDGPPGFVYAFMLATYEAMIAVLAFERARPPGENRLGGPPARDART